MLLARTLRTIPGQVLGPFAQMVSAVAFTHWMSPDDLGVYALAWATQELAYYGVLAWWTAFVQRNAMTHTQGDLRGAFNSAETAVHLGAALVQTLLSCLVIMVVLDEPPTFVFLASLAAFSITRNLCTHFAARARSEPSDGAFTVLQSVGPIGGLALGIAAVALVDPSAKSLLAAYAIAQTASLLIGLPMMRYDAVRPRLDATMLKASWAYGAPLVIANLLEWGANHGVRIVVQFDMGNEGVGLVTIAWWLGLRIMTFVALIVTGAAFAAAVAALEGEGPDAARRQLADNGALLLGLLAPAVTGATLLSNAFAHLAVAATYQDITAALLPFALIAGGMKAFREHAPEQAFIVFGRTGLNALAALVEVVLTLGACGVGLWLDGLVGALAGCAVASIISAIFSQVCAMRSVGYYIWLGDVVRIAVATTVMGIAVAMLPKSSSTGSLLLGVAVGAVVYGAACLVLWRRHSPLVALKNAVVAARRKPEPLALAEREVAEAGI